MDQIPVLKKCKDARLTLTPVFFMNVKGLKNNPQVVPPSLEQQINKAAKMYEKQFLQEMIRAMRSTVDDQNGFMKPSMAEKIYKDELFEQYAEKWVDSGGNGLADVIAKELKEKILPSQHSRYLPKAAPAAEKTASLVSDKKDKK